MTPQARNTLQRGQLTLSFAGCGPQSHTHRIREEAHDYMSSSTEVGAHDIVGQEMVVTVCFYATSSDFLVIYFVNQKGALVVASSH